MSTSFTDLVEAEAQDEPVADRPNAPPVEREDHEDHEDREGQEDHEDHEAQEDHETGLSADAAEAAYQGPTQTDPKEEEENERGCPAVPPAGAASADARQAEPEGAGGVSHAASVVATILAEASGSRVVVCRVASADAVDQSAKKALDRRREKLIAELGHKLSADEIERALAIRASSAKGQRKLEIGADPLSPTMREFFAGREDDVIEADMVKAIRRDGGKYGALGAIKKALDAANVPAAALDAAAHAMNTMWGHRTVAIRQVVTATVNELRVRRAEASGRNPRDESYLIARE